MFGKFALWTANRIKCAMKEFKMGNGIISERAIGLGLFTLHEIYFITRYFENQQHNDYLR